MSFGGGGRMNIRRFIVDEKETIDYLKNRIVFLEDIVAIHVETNKKLLNLNEQLMGLLRSVYKC